ncbi:FtsK/SpoIIIE domain-containing protein [Aquipuribacter sp. MA13-13]|uniref:FtsK/SpoIIIE domain-containing protein n=1 Tax=Aquipuribacter sp. MA13-13 TaxID=3440840 RepID=UPI003EEC4C8E
MVVRGHPGDDGSGPVGRRDVVLDCPAGTTLAQVPGLGATAAGGRPPRVTVGGAPVDPRTAVVGAPPLLDGAVVVLSHGDGPRRRSPRSTGRLLELAVLAGPDAGTVHPLDGERLVCGRAVTCAVAVRDPRMSREHCELVVRSDGVRLVDLGSTNGTTVLPPSETSPPGEAADVEGPRLGLGEECVIGASLVTLRAVAPAVVTTARPAGDGTLLLRRSPRVHLPETATVVQLPTPARPSRTTGFPVLAVLLPAAAAGGLALWTGSAVYLLLAALGPLLVAGGWVSARREARRDGRLSRGEHARTCARLHGRAQRAAAALAGARRVSMPDADMLLRQAAGHGPRVWEREPGDADALRVRLGRAAGDGDGPQAASLRPQVVLVDPDGVERPVSTPADLVSVDLRAGPLGLVEPDGDPSVARFVVGQLATLLPPGGLHVLPVLGARARERWRWLTLTPHVLGTVDGRGRPAPAGAGARTCARWVGDLVRERTAARGGPAAAHPGPSGRTALLVVVDDPDGELASGELAWLPDAAAVDVHVVVVAPDATMLPRGCGTVAAPTAPDGVELTVTVVGDGSAAVCVADRVGPWWSERLARHLAPLRAPAERAPSTLPERAPLDDLLDGSPAATLERWAASGSGLPVPIGMGRAGPVVLDLVAAGPHALVAGTTGSGKSELLRAWLLGLALCHPPEHVAMLLVDYKGGATFDELSRLPHVVGLLTDLDSGATTRVLHSLRAEVRRRERLMAASGARDLDQLRAWRGVDLPRLLVVVDEFRVLAEDAPDVLAEFVRLAATGRSLGLHLVLATQRPAGVVSADIRANTGLRIALRVQDVGESRDVVDRPDAAWLPHDRPGRAVVVGAGVDETLQAAWVGGGAEPGPSLTVLGPGASWWPTLAAPDGDDGDDGDSGRDPRRGTPQPTPQTHEGAGAEEVVDQVLAALTSSGRAPAACPWLPPLPARLRRGDLPDDGGPTGSRLRLGLTDLPWAQARGELTWDPVHDGPALVLGGPRSGRSTTLQAMAQAADRLEVAVVRLDGATVEGDHAVDVLMRLAETPPDAPPPTPAPAGTTAPTRPTTATPAPAPATTTTTTGRLRVLLLVDDCDTVLDPAADPEPADLLLRVLRSGHRAGIGVALAGGRATAVSRLAAATRLRLVHRTADPADATLAGVPGGVRVGADVPGRCLVVGLPVDDPTTRDGPSVVEAQVLAPDGADHAPPGRSDGRGGGRGGGRGLVASAGWPVRPLPARVDVTSLPVASSAGLPLGVVAPQGSPWWLEVGATPVLAVVGPARSGRSTALATIRRQALAAGVPTAGLSDLSLPGSARTCLAGDDGSAGGDGPPPAPVRLLLVDDVERCSPDALQHLEQWLSGGTGALAGLLADAATVVVTGSTDWFAGEFRGVPAVVRRHGFGVVLGAGRTDVRDVLGCRDPLRQRTHLPGRGVLVERGRAARIQIALAGTAG